MLECFIEVGFLCGVVNLVYGLGDEVGEFICWVLEMCAIFFMGSNVVGYYLYWVGAECGVCV